MKRSFQSLMSLPGYFTLFVLFLASCGVDNGVYPDLQSDEGADARGVTNEEPSVGLSTDQAVAYVKLFGSKIGLSLNTDTDLRSSETNLHEVGNVDCYVENGDTLLFAVNYKDNDGFVLLSADNSSFPIIAHSDQGHFSFQDLNEDSPVKAILDNLASRTRKNLNDPLQIQTEYFENWKDIGSKDYQYEIELLNEPPTAPLRARTESSGKESVYPSTGIELNNWSQDGAFRKSAPNGLPIGCPAVAIGMLLYDCSYRMGGKLEHNVFPHFNSYAASGTENNNMGEYVSTILRQIADSIPNYDWNYDGSGANPDEILTGLHRLGFKNARLEPYNFEKLYQNLRFKSTIYGPELFDVSRGVLLGAYKFTSNVGHVWFCDGYYEQSFKVTKKFLFIKIKSWTEYDDRLYMNWGHGPNEGNGWYTAEGDLWYSLDHEAKDYKRYPMMYTGLDYYEAPRSH